MRFRWYTHAIELQANDAPGEIKAEYEPVSVRPFPVGALIWQVHCLVGSGAGPIKAQENSGKRRRARRAQETRGERTQESTAQGTWDTNRNKILGLCGRGWEQSSRPLRPGLLL